MSVRIIIDPLKLNETQRRNVAALIVAFDINAINEPETIEEPTPAAAFAPVAQPPVIHVSAGSIAPEEINAAMASEVSKVIPMPAAPPAPPAPVTTAPELDASGIPWDERIHSSSKAKTEKGEWRRKRGVDDSVFTKVEAELKTLMGIPAAPAPVAAPVAPVAVPPPPAPAPVAAPVAPVAVPPPPAAQTANGTREQYVELIKLASVAISQKKLAKDELDAICAQLGVSSLPSLASRLDLVPAVMAELNKILATR